MDNDSANSALLSSERSSEASDILIKHGPWRVKELELVPGKSLWLWNEMKKYRTLFSDFTKDNEQLFIAILRDPYSYWLEVIDEDDQTVGMMYVTDLDMLTDANIHLMFFDRKAAEKSELVKEMVELVFKKFTTLNRLTASFPELYHATIRLARRAGFTEEGRRRAVTMIGGRPQDELIFGILAEEALSGSD